MPEPLKNVYSLSYLQKLAATMAAYTPNFNQQTFLQRTINDANWPQRALKDRMACIAEALYRSLDLPYPQALSIVEACSNHFGGGEQGDFASMFFPEIVAKYGIGEEHYSISMRALAHFTTRSSSEFAIRPFLIRYPQKTLQQLHAWAQDDNEKIRRLASEGCRPRLPWAIALPQFKQNPNDVLQILELLKDDPSLFVRRSVANNLNDIAKDNPAATIATCKRWYGKNDNRNWLVKHACRGLLKQSHPEALALFGYNATDHISLHQLSHPATVSVGEDFTFSFQLLSKQTLGKLRVEFLIGFMKANGKRAEKAFHISETDFEAHRALFEKTFSFKPVSTRKYYTGEHNLIIRVNGKRMSETAFKLLG